MNSAKPPRSAGQLQFEWFAPSTGSGSSPPESPNDSATPNENTESPVNSAVDAPADNGCTPRVMYEPGHPWNYLACGDNAAPIAFDDIPASEDSARSMQSELPNPISKRIVAVRDRLESEKRELAAARIRYQEIVDRGAEALSRYDREIAYGGNDELARAGTLALLFTQAAWRKGRVAALEQEASRTTQLARRR